MRGPQSLPCRPAQILQEMPDGALLLPLLFYILSTHTDTSENLVTRNRSVETLTSNPTSSPSSSTT